MQPLTSVKVADPNVAMLQTGIIASQATMSEYVRQLGGTIITSVEEPVDYRLSGIGIRHKSTGLIDDLLKKVPDVPSLPEASLSTLSSSELDELEGSLDNGNSWMLAYRARDRGHGKYLLETSDQLAKIVHLGRVYTEKTGKRLYDNFMVRPYVKTPSNYFTSYRVLVNSAGYIQGAGLLYSGHAKNSDRKIVHACKDFGDSRLAFMVRRFEDPESPYFLDARDVRSNILCGGSMIALMGENRQPLRDGEAAILEAHNIDPSRTQIPRDIAQIASSIGRLIGPELDLVLGLDFIQNTQDERSLLEVNCGPTAAAYNVCHLAGMATMSNAMAASQWAAINHLEACYRGRSYDMDCDTILV